MRTVVLIFTLFFASTAFAADVVSSNLFVATLDGGCPDGTAFVAMVPFGSAGTDERRLCLFKERTSTLDGEIALERIRMLEAEISVLSDSIDKLTRRLDTEDLEGERPQ